MAFSNDDLMKISLELLDANFASDVVDILDNLNLYSEPKAWRDFGDNENNFSTIGNQQSLPEVALVEKIINSVDSILTSKSRAI